MVVEDDSNESSGEYTTEKGTVVLDMTSPSDANDSGYEEDVRAIELELNEDEELEYDTDDVARFVDRDQYLKESSEADVFVGLSAEDAKKKEVEVAKKGKGHYRSLTKHTILHDRLT